MKNRFYSSVPLTIGTSIDLDRDEAHHARVLRVHEGEAVEVFDTTAHNFAARVVAVARDRVTIDIAAPKELRESPVALTLALALIQPEKFELVLQKGTELGVHRFIPIVAELCEVRPERVRGKRERWAKIVLEAVKQSGRSKIPPIDEPLSLADALATPGTKIFFDASAPAGPLSTSREAATLFVGPEGGWSEAEIALAVERGCHFRTLGPRRLRAETAAIAALVVAGSLAELSP